MSVKASKKSLLDYFKAKPTVVVVDAEGDVEDDDDEAKQGVEDVEEVVEEEESKTAAEDGSNENGNGSSRRPTRACASKARLAWNSSPSSRGRKDSSSSDEDDFKEVRQSGRKRTRNSCRKKQATLSKNGTLVLSPKDKDNNNSKKKVKLDPEREAFLRSGVPDVILKSRAKSETNGEKEKKEPVQEKRKTMDAATLAFLHSSVPDSIIKAQQSVEKKREQNDFLINMGFFPKISHTVSRCEGNDIDSSTKDNLLTNLPFKVHQAIEIDLQPVDYIVSDSQEFRYLSQESKPKHVGFCCDENPIEVCSQEEVIEAKSCRPSGSDKSSSVQNSKDSRPWIDKLKVTSVKNLVVDPNALETLTRWIKQWKMDIKDDGGTSRKQEKKKKRGNSSDSDFVTSDEGESEMKKKSVLLTGPSGCGKTAAVYMLAKHYDFEVVEVNFSSRRPGKEVLQRVEEAVLSHRLKTSHNCLLLFKDIDLLHPEEDEGFFSAVAQLITTAVRPIVMTSCLPVYCLIDSKLDRKDPLRISFSYPKPREIVDKILKPILQSSQNQVSLVQSSQNSPEVDKWLDSIVRHSGCDIRQCINQLQLVLSTSSFRKTTCLTNEDIHLYSSPFQPHLVDLNFPRQQSQSLRKVERNSKLSNDNDEDDEEVIISSKASKARNLKQLRGIAYSLELFSDLDWISKMSKSSSIENVNMFGDVDEAKEVWGRSSMRLPFFKRLSSELEHKAKVDLDMVRQLVLESDSDIDKWMQIEGMNDEIAEYSDRPNASCSNSWETCGAVRTIVKRNLLDSTLGRAQKRHGRQATYFNRMNRDLQTKIKDTLGFKKEMEVELMGGV